MRAAAPLTFAWPTSLALEPGGAVLVVENGLHRLVRVDPRTRSATEVAANLAKPYAVARARSGSVFVTDADDLLRLGGTRSPKRVAHAAEDIGPIAVAADGSVYFTTSTGLFRVDGSGGRAAAIASGLGGPHGIAVAPDGTILVSDTEHNRVRRIDPAGRRASTLLAIGSPRGLDVAKDGTIYAVESATKRLVRFSRAGRRLGNFGPAFGDPYDVALAADAAYVLDTSAAGTLVRVGRDGRATTI